MSNHDVPAGAKSNEWKPAAVWDKYHARVRGGPRQFDNVALVDEADSRPVLIVIMVDHSESMTQNKNKNIDSVRNNLRAMARARVIEGRKVRVYAWGSSHMSDSRNRKYPDGLGCVEYCEKMGYDQYFGGTSLASCIETLALCAANNPDHDLAVMFVGDGQITNPDADVALNKFIADAHNKMVDGYSLIDRIASFTFQGTVSLSDRTPGSRRINTELSAVIAHIADTLKSRLVQVLPFNAIPQLNGEGHLWSVVQQIKSTSYRAARGWVSCCNITWNADTATPSDIIDFINQLDSRVAENGSIVEDPTRARSTETIAALSKFLLDVIKSAPKTANEGGYAKIYAVLQRLSGTATGARRTTFGDDVSKYKNELTANGNLLACQDINNLISASYKDTAATTNMLPLLTNLSTTQLRFTGIPADMTADAWEAAIKQGDGAAMCVWFQRLIRDTMPVIEPLNDGVAATGLPLPRADRCGEHTMSYAAAAKETSRIMARAWGMPGYLDGSALARAVMIVLSNLTDTIEQLRDLFMAAIFEGPRSRRLLCDMLGICDAKEAETRTAAANALNIFNSKNMAHTRYRFFNIYKEILNQDPAFVDYYTSEVEPVWKCIHAYEAIIKLSRDPMRPQYATRVNADAPPLSDGCFALVKHDVFSRGNDPFPELPYLCVVLAVRDRGCRIQYLDDLYIGDSAVKQRVCDLHRAVEVRFPSIHVNKNMLEIVTSSYMDELFVHEMNVFMIRLRHEDPSSVRMDAAKQKIAKKILQVANDNGRPHHLVGEFAEMAGVDRAGSVIHVPIDVGHAIAAVASDPQYAFVSKIDAHASDVIKADALRQLVAIRTARNPAVIDQAFYLPQSAGKIRAAFDRHMAPEIIRAPLTHRECCVSYEVCTRLETIPMSCGHIMRRDIHDDMLKSHDYNTNPWFLEYAHKCPICRIWVTYENPLVPWWVARGLAAFIKNPRVYDAGMLYRKCDYYGCPSGIFAAGPKQCADDPTRLAEMPTMCEAHRVTTKNFFYCGGDEKAGCGMGYQHESGCRLMRCCPRGYHGCPNDRGGFCRHKLCDHGALANCGCMTIGCGRVWNIDSDEQVIGNPDVVVPDEFEAFDDTDED